MKRRVEVEKCMISRGSCFGNDLSER
jgi:hypothetical protein